MLFRSVDDSPDSLADWLEALDALTQWCDAQDKTPMSDELIGYVACCSESQAGHPVRLPLPEVVRQMLEDFGFESSSDG